MSEEQADIPNNLNAAEQSEFDANFAEVCAQIDAIATSVNTVVSSVPGQVGKATPYDRRTSIEASVLAKEGEPTVRSVYEHYYVTSAEGGRYDRGTRGYNIYQDGRVTSHVNSERNGIHEEDDPGQYTANLAEVKRKLEQRQSDLERTDMPNTSESEKIGLWRRWLGGIVTNKRVSR